MSSYECGYFVDFLLSRDYSRLVTTVGIDDTATVTDVPVRFEVYGDENLLEMLVVNYGEHVDLKIDVTGVLRLRLQAREIAGGDYDYLDAVFGSPIVSANTRVAVYPPVG